MGESQALDFGLGQECSAVSPRRRRRPGRGGGAPSRRSRTEVYRKEIAERELSDLEDRLTPMMGPIRNWQRGFSLRIDALLIRIESAS